MSRSHAISAAQQILKQVEQAREEAERQLGGSRASVGPSPRPGEPTRGLDAGFRRGASVGLPAHVSVSQSAGRSARASGRAAAAASSPDQAVQRFRHSSRRAHAGPNASRPLRQRSPSVMGRSRMNRADEPQRATASPQRSGEWRKSWSCLPAPETLLMCGCIRPLGTLYQGEQATTRISTRTIRRAAGPPSQMPRQVGPNPMRLPAVLPWFACISGEARAGCFHLAQTDLHSRGAFPSWSGAILKVKFTIRAEILQTSASIKQ